MNDTIDVECVGGVWDGQIHQVPADHARHTDHHTNRRVFYVRCGRVVNDWLGAESHLYGLEEDGKWHHYHTLKPGLTRVRTLYDRTYDSKTYEPSEEMS